MDNVELDEVQWRSPEWVQAFGLRTDNVLDYFSMSPFYDRSSNNQVLKMQTNFNEQLQSRGSDITKELEKMVGIEYRISVAREPDLWAIQKLYRKSPSDVDLLAVYFVSGENIYQSPSIYNVLVSRLLAISKNVEEALGIAEQLPRFTSRGYEYKEKAGTLSPPKEVEEKDQESRESKAQENNAMLDRALNASLSSMAQSR